MKPPRAGQFGLFALLAVIAIGGAARTFEYGVSEAGVDFYQFWWVSRTLGESSISPASKLYSTQSAATLGAAGVEAARLDVEAPRRARAAEWFSVLQPMGTPFFYTALRPLAALPYEAAQRTFLALSLLLSLCGLLWLGRKMEVSWAGCAAFCIVATVGFEPMASDVRVANVNRLLCGGLIFYLALALLASRATTRGARRQGALWSLGAGVFAGLLTAFKPVVLPIFAGAWLWTVARGRWRVAITEAVGGAVGVGVGIGIGALAFGGLEAWSAWAASWSTLLPGHAISVAYGNYAPFRWLDEAIGAGRAGHWVFVALAALCAVALVVRGVRSRAGAPAPPLDAREGALALGFGFLLLVLTSRLVWLHYEVLALPALAALAPLSTSERTSIDTGDVSWTARARPLVAPALWAIALACVALEPLRIILALSTPMAFGAVVVVGNLLLGALVLHALWVRLGTREGAELLSR